ADDTGFQSGDVIAEVNGQTVTTLDEYRKAVANLKPGQNVVFKILRRNGDRTMTMFLPGVVPADNK
ncbi:MAG TPA: PDZ domain-containing protein, partial [Terriglobales bacterium]|nr:PDZ domain-containing protein [Terriglobales bacterium]